MLEFLIILLLILSVLKDIGRFDLVALMLKDSGHFDLVACVKGQWPFWPTSYSVKGYYMVTLDYQL